MVEKNPNVAADLSGLLEGRVDLDAYFREQAGYVFLLRTWLTAIQCWDKVMFGTDWPIVNLGEYIGFIRRLVPETHWSRCSLTTPTASTAWGCETAAKEEAPKGASSFLIYGSDAH